MTTTANLDTARAAATTLLEELAKATETTKLYDMALADLYAANLRAQRAEALASQAMALAQAVLGLLDSSTRSPQATATVRALSSRILAATGPVVIDLPGLPAATEAPALGSGPSPRGGVPVAPLPVPSAPQPGGTARRLPSPLRSA